MYTFNYVLFILCYFIATVSAFETTAITTQTEAVMGLIKRIIPAQAHKFEVIVDPTLTPGDTDTFHIEKLSNGNVQVAGSSGVGAAAGFHHYLKYYCNCHISWEMSNLMMPNVLPAVNITVTFNDRYRYYQNVCTTSYSFVWWDWKQWEKHIDWMVLNSFNFVLAFNGQEEIWRRVYRKLGLTDKEIDDHFTGPAFLSWNRMGNMRGWGGPLSKAWHTRSLVLQHLILKRMRSFGVTPILPAFAGHVPRAFKRLFPQANMTKTEKWNNFNDTYCCPYLLDPTGTLFKIIGSMFLTDLIAEFGTDHAYSCDTFNEMQPASGDISYLKDIGSSVYAAMTSVDPKAIWVMQNWLFVHDFIFWTADKAEALITSVPLGKMIVLDLQSEQHPQYKRLKSYYGQPFIWCMLHDFGGTLGMFGSMNIINKEVFTARNMVNSTMIGTGITPEGINQNYVVYDLMAEMSWRKQPANLTEWLNLYTTRRYGQKEDGAFIAWHILKDSVYNYEGLLQMRGKYAINRSPSTHIRTWIWYDYCDLLEAWSHLINSASVLQNNEGYLHDLVDVTRQVLQVFGDRYYKKFMRDFKAKKVEDFQNSSKLFLELLHDLDSILATNRAFLLGPWLNSAKKAASTHQEERLFEYNARNQITLWGPNGEISDYANKQWSGVVSHYFLPRWSLFLNKMNESLVNNKIFNESYVRNQVFKEIEQLFTFERNEFPNYPSGNTVQTAINIKRKWWRKARCKFIK